MTGEELPARRLRRLGLELAAMAQTGNAFARDRYDVKRFARLAEIAAEIQAALVGTAPEEILSRLEIDGGYATPHVDVRGVLVRNDRILLVQEAADRCWTLPGGWADVLDTPRVAVEREFAEEAGLAVRADRLAFVHDGVISNGHLDGGPPFHIWKLFFICTEDAGGEPQAGLDEETTDVGFFGLDDLPPLSARRTTEAQLRLALTYAAEPSRPAVTD
ncbi:MAG: NUDIX hydrolase N-terminal domain-containing protein [Mycobacteriales bacterium]